MPRLPRVTSAELLRALRRDGWQERRSRGGHIQLIHPNKPGRVTVSAHPGDIVPPKTLTSILGQAGLTVDELRDLL